MPSGGPAGRGARSPRNAPSPSRSGSSRNHASRRMSAGAAGAGCLAAAIASPSGPAQARGPHGLVPAPSVVDAMSATAPRATPPGPIHRSHRDSAMRVDLLRRLGQLAGGGRGRHRTRRPLSAAYLRRGSPWPGSPAVREPVVGWYSGRDNQSRRVVAKPVRFRHSPATVIAPPRAEVRSPTHGACSNLREKGRQDRAPHRLTPLLRRVPKRGVARAWRRPLRSHIPSRRLQPCSRPCPPVPRRRPAGSWPRSLALVLVLAACTGSAGPSPVASSSTAIATAAPTATPLPTPTADARPGLPGHPHRRRGHERHHRRPSPRRSSR